MGERRIEPGGCAPAVYVGEGPALRWYFKRAETQVALVCERRDDARGYQVIVHDRRHAREWLPKLRALVLAIDTAPRRPTRTYTPEEADV